MPAVPTPPPAPTCATCKFFAVVTGRVGGTCRRYPFAATVASTYWCGEWLTLPPLPIAGPTG